MKTSITWPPAAGLNIVSVELGEQAWTVTLGSGCLLPVRGGAVCCPIRATAPTREHFGICPLKARRSL